ncbi:MAG TPA: zinc-binding alcohol dehydrogenase family protein [Polyangium sp.]|nr:zinc-binding alcohol dehydrogenase family protein [Polyangium sp.]
MKAVGYTESGSIDRADALIDLDLPIPEPGPKDLRVKISAVSVNPVDTKIRRNRAPKPGVPEVLGWDAVGVVDAFGAEVKGFSLGDRVYYAGAINRPGTNSEYHVVDARIVGHAPKNLSDIEAAALPLTTITAWEMLFDRLGVARGGGEGQRLLIIGAAGGVGSIQIQLARKLTKLTIIATASRPETQAWCRELGAHHVIDHTKPFGPQLADAGVPHCEYIAALTQSDEHWMTIVESAAPQGKICLIDDPPKPLDIMALKRKSLALIWELMYTRSLYETPDMGEQGALLDEVAKMVDEGSVRTTVTETGSPINAENLRKAHAQIESGKVRGKIVLHGF